MQQLKESINSIKALLVGWSKQTLIDKPVKAAIAIDKTEATIGSKIQNLKDKEAGKISDAVEMSRVAVFFLPQAEVTISPD